ncbi:phospholipase D-like domain-containing protein [Mesorhizobium sp. M2A.F.Ca.ET.042.01.1.1]|uniref:phospholipase D-like domain-containing protein n=1 Tax=Mesorhizobium sp. M2A.F.Ca.ET.042.01.1.1 TaxID=2496745 RepID=UPI0016740FB1|nr:phospholipase D-like domain-containing protein [Mesorhizobium sp. M2A.F.Ca.ET.042.01.1.1]
MTQTSAGIEFKITPEGLVVTKFDSLPTEPRRLSRSINFVVDQLTGAVFRTRDLPFLHQHMVEERAKYETVVWIQRPERPVLEGARALVDALFQDDEMFVAMDNYGDRLMDRWALVTVRDGQPEGLTPRAPKPLVEAIVEAAKRAEKGKAPGESHTVFLPQPIELTARANLPIHQVHFSTNDIILGGSDHETALLSVLSKARHRVVIHSTFIAEDRFTHLLPHIKRALASGATVDILWGQDGEAKKRKSTLAVVQKIRAFVEDQKIDNLRVHPFSTTSHSKIILADDGSPEKLLAIIGSCNWLYSGFTSFEASVRLRDPKVVADVADLLAELSRGSLGHWTELTSDLTAIATTQREKPSSSGKTSLAIVQGQQHAGLVLNARDECRSRLFVTSHKFSDVGRSAILAPALAAAQANGVEVDIYYGEPSGKATGTDVAEMTIDASKLGAKIRPVRNPMLHAKMLIWDDDAAVISSQNWLSSDPAEDNPLQEIGVVIRSSGVGKNVVEKFNVQKRS